MRVAESVLSLAALLALVLNLTHVYEGVWAMVASFGALAVFYLALAVPLFGNGRVGSADRGSAALRKVWAQATGCVFSLALVGILAAQTGWRLAPFFWTAGMMALVPVGAINLAKHMLKPAAFYRNVALRVALLLLCGLLVVLLQWQPPQS